MAMALLFYHAHIYTIELAISLSGLSFLSQLLILTSLLIIFVADWRLIIAMPVRLVVFLRKQ
jgi:hypothetical protein